MIERGGAMKKDDNTIADKMLRSLTEFADAVEAGDDLGEQFTCHRVILDLKPEPYTPSKVKQARKILSVSQRLFARFLGVSVKTVRSWEHGISSPSPVACRFMDEIRHNPEHYRKRFGELAQPKDNRPRGKRV